MLLTLELSNLLGNCKFISLLNISVTVYTSQVKTSLWSNRCWVLKTTIAGVGHRVHVVGWLAHMVIERVPRYHWLILTLSRFWVKEALARFVSGYLFV